jgi:hypothetical protein
MLCWRPFNPKGKSLRKKLRTRRHWTLQRCEGPCRPAGCMAPALSRPKIRVGPSAARCQPEAQGTSSPADSRVALDVARAGSSGLPRAPGGEHAARLSSSAASRSSGQPLALGGPAPGGPRPPDEDHGGHSDRTVLLSCHSLPAADPAPADGGGPSGSSSPAVRAVARCFRVRGPCARGWDSEYRDQASADSKPDFGWAGGRESASACAHQ